jgi:glycosyltransferase involved in cell wall biosynthesis
VKTGDLDLKIAFITHTTYFGGAALSSSKTIQFLLDNGLLQPEQGLLIQPKDVDPSNEKNDAYFNIKRTMNFYEFNLPFSPIFKGTASNYRMRLYYAFHEVIAIFFFIFFYNKIFKQEKITIVHLNSLVLWPLLLVLPKSIKKIIHIREVPINSIEAWIAIFVINHYATKIISIDPISNISFSKSGKSVVISNPYSMTKSRQMRKKIKKLIKLELGIPPEYFVVSIFGLIAEQKGFDFFLKIIKSSTQIKNLIFVIIGKPAWKYGEKCIQLLKTFSNVKYLGEHNDTSKFYAITDVVIRCEDYLPLGRTVWEGIFAGGLALVPVNKNDDISVIQEYIGKYIFTYQALNVSSCIETLKEIMKQYPDTVLDTGYPVTDNVLTSAEQFFEVIQS